MPRHRGFASALAIAGTAAVVAAGCLRPGAYACEGGEQCRAHDGGACVEGWCAYPDDACDSGLRFGAYAPDAVAQTCVELAGSTGGSTSSGDSSSGSDGADTDAPPVPSCGNGVRDDDEACDDGNRLAGDACPPHCAEPGDVLWTVTYDGEAHSDDRAFGVTIDPDGDSFWVAGFTTVTPEQGYDLLLQRRWVEDGSLVWTASRDGDANGEDMAEDVAIDASGRAWVVGRLTHVATAGDVWVGAFDRDGAAGPSFGHDEQGGQDHGHGVAITDAGTLVISGVVDLGPPDQPDSAAWIRRYDSNGAPLGPAIVRNGSVTLDAALQIVADGEGFVVTGDLSAEDGTEQVWTARYDAADALLWEQLGTAEDVGPFPRGVGISRDGQGGWAVAGVLSSDIWVQRYDGDGTPAANFTVAGTDDRHDEAGDIEFLADGRFIVAGFIDFATVGFATGDAWVRMYAADGNVEWTDVFDGASEETDKALSVCLTQHQGAIVAGYETVPGQSRDVWLRHYAL